MRILIIAPQPYYSERGTPISVELLIRALLERGDQIEVLTYHEGEDRPATGVTIHRISRWIPIRGIAPGPSLKKLVCDFFLFWKAAFLIKKGNYDLVHAIEESSFIAAALCPRQQIPFVYDMDSSMRTQLEDKYPLLRPLSGMFLQLEGWALRRAHAVIPMCKALADQYEQFNPGRFFVLLDVSLRREASRDVKDSVARLDFGCPDENIKFMYLGNLERYQGIDLLLDGFALAVKRGYKNIHLIVVGGRSDDIDRYTARSRDIGISEFVTFCGPRPVSELGPLMERADALLSPRVEGVNTPLKIYSYIDSGRALIATRLATHTQVLDDTLACLVDPDAESMAEGIIRVTTSAEYRDQIATAAKQRAQERHTYSAFRERVHALYSKFEDEIGTDVSSQSPGK
jgi:glycosyltransferase involved in cell wall biosynthesis